MRISGTQAVAADRALVWAALNDPAVLQRSLPGCESVVSPRAGEFDVVLGVQVGPLKARFRGTLQMSDVRPNEQCVLRFRGQGGAMGFAEGTATVQLNDEGGGTVINYTAQAQIGGKLAQLGSRMVDAVARRTSAQFFSAFQQALADAPGVALPAVSENGTSTQGGSAARAAATHLVPAWWLLPATAVGAAAALAGVLLAR
jgi:carbon monoxide dehydrogenase subunit G